MAKLPNPTPVMDTKEKIYNLWLELEEAVQEKKDVAKVHNENIKRIKGEMSEIREEEEEEIKKSQTTVY